MAAPSCASTLAVEAAAPVGGRAVATRAQAARTTSDRQQPRSGRAPARLPPAPCRAPRGARDATGAAHSRVRSQAPGRGSVAAAAGGDTPVTSAEKVLEMQRKLLEQIEERKRLHAQLMERLRSQTDEPELTTADEDELRGLRTLSSALERSTTPPPSGSAPASASSSRAGSSRKASSAASAAGGARATSTTRRAPRTDSPARKAAAAAAAAAAVAAASPPAPQQQLPPLAAAPPAAAPPAMPSLAPQPTGNDSSAAAAAANAALQAEEAAARAADAAAAAAEAAAAAAAEAAADACALPDAADGAAADEEEPPKPLCKERLNVVMVAMECAPWSKTGGLGDVAGALPKALARRGHRTMCIAPRYANYDNAWETGIRQKLRVCGQDVEVGYFHGYIDGVDYVFVDHPCFHGARQNIYGGGRDEVLFRCAMLCCAALEAPWLVSCGGAVYGDENLVFLANDWHTALLPVYLQAYYRDHGKLTFARACLVIHNMAHQGRGPMSEFERLGLPDHWRAAFLLDDPFGGVCMNVFKAGLLAAHRLIAVSHGYAWECTTDMGGWGLAPILRQDGWKLSGIVNGIDMEEWNPAKDPHLLTDGYEQYSPDGDGLRAGKAACKAALQKELGLPVRPDVPLLGFIGRLDYQKGVDIICESAGHMLSQDVQLVMLGTGSADLENALRSMEANHRDRCRGWVGFSVAMAHRITAGADILLMPSRFEPCGLNQLYAMRYGTVPVVHAVGGLRDTVAPFNPFENNGTGWTFTQADSWHLNEAVNNALVTYRQYPDSFRAIQLRGMGQDLSWEVAAQKYEDIMLAAKYQW